MRKIISLCLIAGLGLMVLGPVLTSANGTITTALTRSTGGGEPPIIKAKWEMNGPSWGDSAHTQFIGNGTDNSTAPGAQFLPTGIWGSPAGDKVFSICAIVTDTDGVSDIDGVYTDWYYPSNIAFHPMDPNHSDQTNGGPEDGYDNPDGDESPDWDYGISGCGVPYEDENELFKLSKAAGIKLFCNDIRNGNNNLPTFFPNPAGGNFSYAEICGATGELEKETAYVYCVDKALDWEDPAGDYKVEILAIDKAGVSSHDDDPDTPGTDNPHYNTFDYLPLTKFEVDFNSIAYGSVKLNTHKIISGDKTWLPPTDTRPSVRNLGNTRLYMNVTQDDMNLGTTDGNWNVLYDARVGNNDADWDFYDPDETQHLEDILDLSEVEEMDFSIEIFKFPNGGPFTGTMDLGATAAEFRQCFGQ